MMRAIAVLKKLGSDTRTTVFDYGRCRLTCSSRLPPPELKMKSASMMTLAAVVLAARLPITTAIEHIDTPCELQARSMTSTSFGHQHTPATQVSKLVRRAAFDSDTSWSSDDGFDADPRRRRYTVDSEDGRDSDRTIDSETDSDDERAQRAEEREAERKRRAEMAARFAQAQADYIRSGQGLMEVVPDDVPPCDTRYQVDECDPQYTERHWNRKCFGSLFHREAEDHILQRYLCPHGTVCMKHKRSAYHAPPNSNPYTLTRIECQRTSPPGSNDGRKAPLILAESRTSAHSRYERGESSQAGASSSSAHWGGMFSTDTWH